MQDIRILALDPGTANMGYAVLEGIPIAKKLNTPPRIVDFGVLKTKKTDGTIRERLDVLGYTVQDLLRKVTPDYFVFEDFVEQGKFVGKTYKEMAFLIEHLRLVGRGEGIPVTIYENAEWKKKTLKSAGVNKEQVQHYVSHKLPESILLLRKQPDHVWDSVAIGYCKWLELVI